jgi:uncharacterized protein YjbI with pentapeptide repeats
MTTKGTNGDDADDFAARPLSKKQILESIARKESLADADMRGIDLSGIVFDGVDLERAKMAECNLSRSSFRDSRPSLPTRTDAAHSGRSR